MTLTRHRLVKALLSAALGILPAATIDCDWEDGEFEVNLPRPYDRCYDHDCWEEGYYVEEYWAPSPWGWYW